jgi:hypothetical protein
MFARNLSMHLKADGVSHFKQKLETEIIPLLHKQKGFLDEITFLYLNGGEVQAFSLWETAEDAEAYNRRTYPEMTRIFTSVVEGATHGLSKLSRRPSKFNWVNENRVFGRHRSKRRCLQRHSRRVPRPCPRSQRAFQVRSGLE